jgi:hypothetical protein
MVRHRIVTQRKSAARVNFLIDDFEQFRSPSAINQTFACVSGPGKVVIELVKHVGHDVSPVEWKPLKGLMVC